MPKIKRLFVLGASAGGRKILGDILKSIPNTIDAAFLVVVHGSSDAASVFPKVLSQKLDLEVKEVENGMTIEAGYLYIAKPDHHLIVDQEQLFLSKGLRENRFRPSVDVLFRSAAVTYSNACIGILLTGRLSDGTAGLEAIKKCGGMAMIQNPATAEYEGMPSNAAQVVDIDYVVNVEDMGDVIRKIMQEELPEKKEIPGSVIRENTIATKISSQIALKENLGHQVPISCSSCGGPLWKIEDSKINRYRCHVGHAFTEEALLDSQNESLEEALWVAMRTLEEKKMLLVRVKSDYKQKGIRAMATTHNEQIDEVQQQITTLRRVLQIPD